MDFLTSEKSTRCGRLTLCEPIFLILLTSPFGITLLGSFACLDEGPQYAKHNSRQPEITFTATPYPYVLKGTNVTLLCNGRSNPRLINSRNEDPSYLQSVIFYRNGTRIRKCAVDQRERLTSLSCNVTVQNVNPTERFSCFVYVSLAPCNEAHLRFKIQDRIEPVLIAQSRESYGLNWIQFRCGAIGYPEPQLHWILNGSMIENQNNSQITIFRQPSTFENERYQVGSSIRVGIFGYPLRIQCSASNSVNHSFSRDLDARYIQLKTVKITLNSASLQWKIISSGIGNFAEISSYNVSLVNKKEQYERNRLIDTSEMNFSNLSPNTSYIVKIFGLSAEGERLVSGTVVLTTLAQIPKSRFIKVVNITSRTALIQWQKIPVKKEMYAEILGYKVVITREGIQQNFTTTSNESHIILEDLSQNTTYGVTIRGFSSYGDGPVSDQINFTTLAIITAEPLESTGDRILVPLVTVIGVGILLVAIFVVFVLRRKRIRNGKNINPQELQMRNMNEPFHVSLQILYPEHHNDERSPIEDLSKWEIPRERLVVLGKVLGGGYFGVVKEGIYIRPMINDGEDPDVRVAVKTLKNKNGATELDELLRELEILKHVNSPRHPSIIGLVGACTQEVPALIALEYCARGNLKDLLINSRVDCGMQPDYKNIYSKLTERQLIKFALDIAIGMEFLCEQKVVHRDIASRNILLDKELNPKIGDFGLARKIDTNPHYIVNKNKMLPVKWMALESLEEGKFTTASDVWSFGVLFWEICTLGEEPYSEISPYEILSYVKGGRRMKKPAHCSFEVFSLMESCWDSVPEQRPTSKEISQSLQKMLTDYKRNYVNVTTDSEYSEMQMPTSSKNNSEILENGGKNFLEVPEGDSSGEDSGIFVTSG